MRIPISFAVQSWKNFFEKRLSLFSSASKNYPLSLIGVHYSTKKHAEMVDLFNYRTQTMHKESLHHLLKRKHLLKKFHPLDLMLLSSLAKEEQNRHNIQLSSRTQKIFSESSELNSLNCVNTQYYSDRHHREMIIMTIPNSDHQVCLSVRELVNDRDLINKIRQCEFKNQSLNDSLEDIHLVTC